MCVDKLQLWCWKKGTADKRECGYYLVCKVLTTEGWADAVVWIKRDQANITIERQHNKLCGHFIS